MHKLVIQDDEGKTTVVPLIKDEITVGRKEGNTIRLTERNVSRRHARIVRSNGTVEIEDLDSYNGVKVNGARIQGRTHLSPSDRIQIGDYLIELKSDSSPGPSGPTVDEQPTRPIPQASVSASAIPVISEAMEDAETTKMPVGYTIAEMLPQSLAPHVATTTDPGRPAVGPAPEAPVTPEVAHGRLVILSEHFAGQEFDLKQPAVVIGRTDDNDIVINHRSISRHHAKVVMESGRYAIVDLQSSNGVRVNGEEYGRAELRRGDVIDLGHVRLRFIEPGEDFLFGRDAQAVPIPSGGGRGWLYALLVLLVIGAAGAYALTRGDDSENSDAVVTPATKDAGKATDAGARNDASPVIPIRKNTNDQIAGLLDKADAAVDAEKWEEVAEYAKQVFVLDQGNETAKNLQAKAEHEMKNRATLDKFTKLAAAKDFEGAARAFQEFDADSIYKDKAQDSYDALSRQYVAQRVADAKKVGKNCGRINELIRETKDLWKDVNVQPLDEVLTRCQQAGKTQQNNNTSNNNTPDAGTTTQPDNDGDFDQLSSKMNDEGKKGHYGAALRYCGKAYKQKPSPGLATNCGFFACKVKDGKEAKKYHDRASNKAQIYQTCLTAGIDLNQVR